MSRNSFTYPLSVTQYQILINLLMSDSMYNTLNAGRQSGKTFIMSRLASILAIIKENKGCKILVVAPYNVQSDTFFFNVLQIEGIDTFIHKTIQSPYKSILFNNNSVIDFRSADNPKSIRSKSYNFIFLDEFAFFKDGAFDLAIVPTLIASGNKCKLFFSSTPDGVTGLFYELCLKGQDITETNYTYNYINYNDNPNANYEIIESERLRQPSNRFKQEFLGEFISDGGDVFTDIDKILIIDKIIPYNSVDRYYAGIDWGRASDDTVLTILNKNKECVYCNDFQGSWEKQINDISLILKEYKPIVYAETNGIGDPLLTQLKKEYANVNPFITSNSSKKEIVENLRMCIMKDEIKLFNRKLSPKLYTQMSNFTYSTTKTGLITYHHRPQENDDYVDSVCIANYCYDKHNIGFKAIYKQRS